jgi:16S rRNA A1518/A1519 N6-dimethyltransferase RsmA/KsgA/DIM1 with predicted DNA glycosylase/AP lyase activity
MNLNNFNDWAISYDVYKWIKKNIKNSSTILELGSGTGTKELCKLYTVYSVEHNQKWVNYTSSNYIHAPIKNQNGYNWYDIDILKKELPKEYDLILIDGPPGSIGRKPFLDNLNLFNLNVPIIIDDTNRKAEQELFLELNKKLNRKFEVISNRKKESKVIL